jgi:hypothetical protein
MRANPGCASGIEKRRSRLHLQSGPEAISAQSADPFELRPTKHWLIDWRDGLRFRLIVVGRPFALRLTSADRVAGDEEKHDEV